MTGTDISTTSQQSQEDDRWNVMHTDKIAPFIPDGFSSVYKFSQLIAASGMAPKDMKTSDQIAVAIFHGMELGLTPMSALQSIAVINGRPSIWGDGALAVVRASGELEEFNEYTEGGAIYLEQPKFDELGKMTKAGIPNPEFKAICHIKRKGKEAKEYEFSVLDSIEAGLYNKEGPWRNYRKRMLKMRARGFALRDEFTDVMRGLHLAEEVQDYDMDGTVVGREEPPEADEPPAETKPRKPRAPRNKYQEDDKKNVEEAEVLEETKAPAKKEQSAPEEDEDPPAEEEKKAPKVEKVTPPKVEPKKAEPPKEDDFLTNLLSEVGPDKELKNHLTYLSNLLSPLTNEADMRDAWSKRDQLKGMVASQKEFINRLRDHFKSKLEQATSDEDPPAEQEGNDREFDYDGFIAELDRILGEETSPEKVNEVYAQLTAGPIKDGLVTTEMVEEGFKKILAEHLERTDYGA